MNNISTEIKDILHQGIQDITSKVKAQASWIIKLEDCRRYEDEYTTNLDILRAEFGRVWVQHPIERAWSYFDVLGQISFDVHIESSVDLPAIDVLMQ